MKAFMGKDFLLGTETAQQLYDGHAANLPIIDYHCHLDPRMVAEDHRFNDITELWLGGDHYKWRAMRTNGIEEKYITGDASAWEKFYHWADTLEHAMRNPLYHWAHLELSTAFNIHRTLNTRTAREIFDECNEKLQQPDMTAVGLMKRYKVEVVCTTDDPVDSLCYHEQYRKQQATGPRMLPAWRPDKAMTIDRPTDFNAYVDRLAEVAETDIRSYRDLIEALRIRHDFFASQGCSLSDHGIDRFYADDYTESQVNQIFSQVRAGHQPNPTEVSLFRSALLYDLALMDDEKGWVQQYHYGPQRNNNSRMMALIGPDTGFDSIGQCQTALSMARFLDRLDAEGHLTKTILYNLNPADNEMVASMIGNFQQGPQPGKIQWGAAWWFSDQKDGIERHLNTLSQYGLLSRFVGMLTDSRSFLSYPRHEYFRRILCNLIGRDVEAGEMPQDEMPLIEQMVEAISYYNARDYFKLSSSHRHTKQILRR